MEAVRLLNEGGYLTILISNQPGIARGNLTEDALQDIHDKMNLDLQNAGANIDKIYYCPHKWDEGCGCRKPRPEMLYQAQKEFSLNLRNTYLIGDDERDIEAGEKAGCRNLLVDEDYTVLDAVRDILGGVV